ncbi:MAG: DUF4445 domain-containing protein [Chloroflexi bacterium]|nr:DUF4445 domain-containing protein [Chloroflexota bacterium]
MVDYILDFQPLGRKDKCQQGESILACARRWGLGISSVCGGRGTCYTCRVQVTSGMLSEPTSSELEAFSAKELADGWRLACQAYPASNCRVVVPPESMTTTQRICLEGLDTAVSPEPAVKAYHLKLTPPSLSDPQADADRLLSAINAQHQPPCRNIDIEVLRSFSPRLRTWNWECQALVRNEELVALSPYPSRQLGLAIDLGTTTIAGYLVDLTSGHTLASQGVMNPQIGYGEDIISRIDYVVKSPLEGMTLQKLVAEKLNGLASALCAQVGENADAIVEGVIVGNTAMHHLFLGLSVRQLALTPFTAAASLALDIKARELGVNIAPGDYLHFLPNVAGFVGADHVAMLLATDLSQSDDVTIALDIGTNTEISLVNGDQITATSCASGPAFEGGHIKHGMRGARGAIERLRIAEDAIQYQTIENAPPIGICGSGVLDALAQLYLVGAIDNGGRLKLDHPRVRVVDNQAEFVLVDKEEQNKHPAIVLTQKDVRELQLAKAAIRSGIQLLLEVNHLTEEQISRVIIAGAFGSYIDVSSAIAVGLLPPLSLNCFQQVGNAAGMGAKLALLSMKKREEAQAIASRIHYVELASIAGFKRTFIEASHLGQYWLKGGKREEFDLSMPNKPVQPTKVQNTISNPSLEN